MLKVRSMSITFEVLKTLYDVDANKYHENKTVKISRNMRRLVNNWINNVMKSKMNVTFIIIVEFICIW